MRCSTAKYKSVGGNDGVVGEEGLLGGGTGAEDVTATEAVDHLLAIKSSFR
jgi:hypothetical protein